MAASRRLELTLMADAKKFGKGVGEARGALGKLGGAAKTAGKFALGAVGGAAALGGAAFAMASKVAGAGDEIHKASQKIGVGVEQYQELKYWADQNGVSQDTMERAVGRLTQRMGRAAEGNEKMSGAFERLGVSVHDSNGEMRATEDVLPEVIANLSAIEDPATRAAVAGELLGTKTARDLMPALDEGALSLEDAAAKAHDLGIVMDGEAVDASVKFTDTLADVKESALGMMRKALMPVVQFFADKMLPFIRDRVIPMVQRFSEWIGPKLTDAAKRVSTFFRDKLIPTVRNVARWFREDAMPVLKRLRTFIVENVVPALKRLAEWFREKVLPAARALIEWIMGTLVPGIKNTVVPIIDGFRDALATIKERFDDNSDAISGVMDKIEPLASFIVTRVAPVIGTILGEALKLLGELIGGVIDAIGWLVEKIEAVVGWFQTMKRRVDSLLGPLRTLKRLAKAAGDVVGGIGGKISGAASRFIPGLAHGGIVTRPTLAMVGEGSEDEAVLPLSKLEKLIGGGNGGITINVTGAMMDPEGAARAVERAMADAHRRTGGRVGVG